MASDKNKEPPVETRAYERASVRVCVFPRVCTFDD